MAAAKPPAADGLRDARRTLPDRVLVRPIVEHPRRQRDARLVGRLEARLPAAAGPRAGHAPLDAEPRELPQQRRPPRRGPAIAAATGDRLPPRLQPAGELRLGPGQHGRLRRRLRVAQAGIERPGQVAALPGRLAAEPLRRLPREPAALRRTARLHRRVDEAEPRERPGLLAVPEHSGPHEPARRDQRPGAQVDEGRASRRQVAAGRGRAAGGGRLAGPRPGTQPVDEPPRRAMAQAAGRDRALLRAARARNTRPPTASCSTGSSSRATNAARSARRSPASSWTRSASCRRTASSSSSAGSRPTTRSSSRTSGSGWPRPCKNAGRPSRRPKSSISLAPPWCKSFRGGPTPRNCWPSCACNGRRGRQEYRTQYAQQLFNTLLGQPWSAAYEDELFALVDKLSDAEEPVVRLVSQVGAIHRLTDTLVTARYQAKLKELKNPEKLTRTELRDKQAEYLRAAREGFAERLDAARAKAAADLAPWITVERLYLDVLLDRNLEQVAEECWEIVGPRPVKLGDDAEPKELLAAVLRNRCLLTMCNLAARKDADAGARRPAAEVRRRRHGDGQGRPPLAAAEVRTAGRAGPAQGPGKGPPHVDRRRRPRQPLAAGAGLPAGRAGQAGRGDQALPGGGRGRRTRPGRVPRAGRLVHGRQPPRRSTKRR